jgi:Ca-activated chloride channel family protein
VEVQLILVPVTVTDPLGTPVSGLPREAFRLFENGVEQEIRSFSTEDAPVSWTILFDASQSMAGKLAHSREAVKRFLDAARPGDEYSLVEFKSQPNVLSGFTTDDQRLEGALLSIVAESSTALFDAVYLGIHQLKRARNARKALLVLSDGGDNSSRYTEPEMKALVREADVGIYSIGLTGGGWIDRHVALLKTLSRETGGLLCRVDNPTELPGAVAKINRAIRNQYVLGYVSNRPSKDGLYRKIEVRLKQSPDLPRLRATWRRGYYASSGGL